MQVTSQSFAQGARIPRKHTGEGEDVSPQLAWTGAPAGTQAFALICDDPDAPTPEPWVHWVLYGLNGSTVELAEGENGGGVEGKTSWGSSGYRGPMPPPGHGRHRYYFKVYALDAPLDLSPNLEKTKLLEAIRGHILAEGTLMGTYERR